MDIKTLRENLDDGFNKDNLYKMLRLCRVLGEASDNPAPFFVIQKVFNGLVDYWDEVPGAAKEAPNAERELAGPLRELLDAIEKNASIEQVNGLTNQVVLSYYSVNPY